MSLYRLLKFTLSFLLSFLVLASITGSIANKGLSFQTSELSNHLTQGFISISSPPASENNKNVSISCQVIKSSSSSTPTNYRKKYQQAKQRYSRTRNIEDFQKGIDCAKKYLEEYKSDTSNNIFNRLSLLLDITEWKNSSKIELTDKEMLTNGHGWIPRAIIDSEVKTIDERTQGLSIQQDIWLKSWENIINNSKEVYTHLNFISNIFLIKKIQIENDGITNLKKALSSEKITNILLQDLEALRKPNNSLRKQQYAYLLGYIGKLFETGKENNLDLRDFKSKLTALLPKIYGKATDDNLYFAQTSTREALKIIDDLQGSAITTDDFWNVTYQSYQWQWQLGRIHTLNGERESAIAAYSATIQTLETIRKSILSADIEDQFSFRDEVQPVYREYVSLLLEKNIQNQGNLKKARDLIEDLQLAELENFLGCDLPERKVADEVANDDPSAVIVYPIILPDRLEVIFSTLNTSDTSKKERKLTHYSHAINKEELELKLRELRYRLEQPYTTKKTTALSKEIYSWLIKDAEKELLKPSNKTNTAEHKTNPAEYTLLFVADGAFRNIPMAALEDGEGHYLIEKYAVAIAPRLQLLVSDRQRPSNPRAILAGLTGQPDKNFGTLKYVKDEIDAIEKIFKKDFTRLIGQDFTREKLRTNLAKGVDIVHLATHGEFNYAKKDTFILTEEGSSSKVDLNELENLFQINRHPIDLLVLSACETATGDDRDTLGIAGMTVRSGARSSIASLWNIGDNLTMVEFMQNLYDQLIHQGKSKVQAIRQAQLYSIQSGESISQWAPYILVGDWK